MLAAFHDFAFVDDVYDVGMFDGGEAMSYGDGGAALHQAVESLLYQVFAFCVESGSGLIQDENRGVLQDGSSDADALPLTA